MKENKGITMVALVIIIILLLILVGVSTGTGGNLIKQTKLENLKTNMLLIKVKAKEYVENANFNLGTTFEKLTDETEKNNRIQKAREELKGEDVTSTISSYNININDSSENVYYYKLDTQTLLNIGLSNLKSDEKEGWYIIRYDIVNAEVEVYNSKGFESNNTKYYSLSDLQNIEI
ncbi:MAG: hypothetical protein HFJ60_05720 [Clostridia bacterium]|jgi:Tfp pilus assembly protein PilE|nr:hypothetical protein [Clostridia bacterium]